MKCRENGKFISRDEDYVNTHNLEPMIHRVQDAKNDGVLVPNIYDYKKLDNLRRTGDFEGDVHEERNLKKDTEI